MAILGMGNYNNQTSEQSVPLGMGDYYRKKEEERKKKRQELEERLKQLQAEREQGGKVKFGDFTKQLIPASKKVGGGLVNFVAGGVKKATKDVADILFTKTPEYKMMMDRVAKGQMSYDEVKKIAPILGKSNWQVAGDFGEAALDVTGLYGGGRALKAGKTAIKQIGKQGLKQAAKKSLPKLVGKSALIGSGFGGGYGGAIEMQQPETTPLKVLTQTGIGLGVGGALGAGLGIGGGLLSKFLSRKAVPEAEKAITKIGVQGEENVVKTPVADFIKEE